MGRAPCRTGAWSGVGTAEGSVSIPGARAAAAPPPLPAHAPAPAAGSGQQLAFPSPLEFVRQTYSEDTQPQQQADTQVTLHSQIKCLALFYEF